MIHEVYTNVLFGVSSMIFLTASLVQTNYIADHIKVSEIIFHGPFLGIILACLLADVAILIFALAILGNLYDFIAKGCINLIGAGQKLRAVSVIL